VSSAGHALVIAAVLMLLGALVHQLLRGRVPAAAVAGVLGVALAVVYASDLRDRADEYAAATPIQQDVLTMLREELPAPADSQTLLAFNYPRNAVWGVPTFNWWWDLTNAYRMAWRNQSIVAIPVTPDADIACGASELRARGPSLAGAPPARYGNVLAVDIGRRQVAAIDDRQSCRTAVTGLLPAVDVPTR
jgi:hypothetical protein